MHEKNVVSVSGGKDSTATLLLAIEREAENLEAVFADTGHEHRLTYEYINYLNDHVFPIRTIRADFTADIERKRRFIKTLWRDQGVPESKIDRALAVLQPTGIPYLDLCILKGRFPSTRAAFCTEELKRNPITRQVHMPLLESGIDVISWQGVRAEESEKRRSLPERECKITHQSGAELWNYRPIHKWAIEDVFAIHRKHGVDPNPLYRHGMSRVGCMPCINCRKDELLEISRRFPEEIERVAEWERLVAEASRRGVATFFPTAQMAGPNQTSSSEEVSLEKHGVWQAVAWAKTGRGGRQFDLFRATDNAPRCSSVYGLCE